MLFSQTLGNPAKRQNKYEYDFIVRDILRTLDEGLLAGEGGLGVFEGEVGLAQ